MIINNTVINKHLTKARFYKNFNGYLQQDESSNLFILNIQYKCTIKTHKIF